MLRNIPRLISHFAMAVIASKAQTVGIQQSSPKEVLENFCKMDADGKQLGTGHQKELVGLFYQQKPLTESLDVTVVKDYVVRTLDVRRDTAQVIVDYNVWGRVDYSLRFARLTGASQNQPIQIREYISMIRSDKHRELGSDGQWREVQDVLQWRIKTMPSSPHVGVTAAMRYVREMGFRSRDPIAMRNAQATVAELSAFFQARFEQTTEPRQLPSTVLARFVALQTEGKGLTAEGQKELDALLVQPAEWRTDKIHITRDFVVSNAVLMGANGNLYVEYIALGDLDSSLRFTNGVPGGVKVREGYTLALSNKYSLPGAKGKPAQELIGPNRWLVADSPPEQWITVNTAIRYATEMRDQTTDPAIKQNADQTIAKLTAIHWWR